MTYAATARKSAPTDLAQNFTGHLSDVELDYFLQWDRLIDLEADAEDSHLTKSWLLDSEENDKTLSRLAYDPQSATKSVGIETDTLAFRQTSEQDSLSSLGLSGGRVVLSSDATTLDLAHPTRRKSHQMHILRGDVVNTSDTHVFVRAGPDDRSRIERLLANNGSLLFRLDRDTSAAGTGILRQNLINLLTGDKKTSREPGTLQESSRLSRLRDLLIRQREPVFEVSSSHSIFTTIQKGAAASVPGCEMNQLAMEFESLNRDQQLAVQTVRTLLRQVAPLSHAWLEKAMTAKDYSLVQGLPGTGKFKCCALYLTHV